MMKQPVRKIISFLITCSLLIGCYSPSLNLVEVKAIFVSADILQKNPLLYHYLDIVKLTDFIITSFYIKQNVAKGKIPKKSSDDPFGKKHTQSNNWFISIISSLEFKSMQASCTNSCFAYNYAMKAWFSRHVLDDTAALGNYLRHSVLEQGFVKFIAIQCSILPRSDVSDLTKTNINLNGSASVL